MRISWIEAGVTKLDASNTQPLSNVVVCRTRTAEQGGLDGLRIPGFLQPKRSVHSEGAAKLVGERVLVDSRAQKSKSSFLEALGSGRRTASRKRVDSFNESTKGGCCITVGFGCRRIQMDLPVCRYSELGVKLDSTLVHLWTSEHLRFTLVGVGFLE
jgi:hypothetical protein